jgi:hypothetical protein
VANKTSTDHRLNLSKRKRWAARAALTINRLFSTPVVKAEHFLTKSSDSISFRILESIRHYLENQLAVAERDCATRILAGLHSKIFERTAILYQNGSYDAAIFAAFNLVENEIRRKVNADRDLVTAKLLNYAMAQDEPPRLIFSRAIGTGSSIRAIPWRYWNFQKPSEPQLCRSYQCSWNT